MQLIQENPYLDALNSQGDLALKSSSRDPTEKKHRRILGGMLMKRSASRIPSVQSARESKFSGTASKQTGGKGKLNKIDSVLSLVGKMNDYNFGTLNNYSAKNGKPHGVNLESSLSSFSLLSRE
jgi:hypothetical protein